jgi:folate-binding protein YgfZ
MARAGGAAQLIERHGYELPAVFSDTGSEYTAAVTAAAVHDASYWGRLKATGDDALDLLNRMSTNNVIDLQPGQGTPTVLTTDRGRIVDLLGVVNNGDHVLLLTSPGRQQAVIEFLDKYTIMEDLEVEDVTAATAMLALIGPAAAEFVERDKAPQEPGTTISTWEQTFGGRHARVIRHPLGKLPCYYLVVEPEAGHSIWNHLVEQGVTPIGVDAFETVRVSLGVPEFGSELGEPYNPLEAGLIGSVDFTKGCYIGQEVIARLDSYKKVQKYLVALRFDEDAQVSAGASLVQGGQAVGAVTSVSRIPGIGLAGLGYVKTASALAGGQLQLEAPASGDVRIEELSQLFGPGQD